MNMPKVPVIVLAALVAGCTALEDRAGASGDAAVSAEAAALESGVGARLDRYLSAMEVLGFSGAVIVEQEGEVVLRKGYGLRDRESRRPYTPDTVQTHGSITKQMTGAAILLLEDRGALSVRDPISRYFDDVPADKRAMTIHQLLTHSAGLPGSIGRDNEPIGAEAFVDRAMAAPLEFEPGSGYSYSNTGFSLLGIIVERLSGKDYESFLREELLLPAGLAETGYLLPDWDLDRLARGYREGEPWGRVYRREWREDGPGWHLRANGGLHTTVDDMHRWLETVRGRMQGMVGDDEDAAARARSMLNVIERGGNLRSLTLVGSIANVPGSRFADYGRWTTFVRADFDQLAQMWSLLWREDGTYRGTAIGPLSDVPSLILVPMGEGRYKGVRREPPWDLMDFRFEDGCLVAAGLHACREP